MSLMFSLPLRHYHILKILSSPTLSLKSPYISYIAPLCIFPLPLLLLCPRLHCLKTNKQVGCHSAGPGTILDLGKLLCIWRFWPPFLQHYTCGHPLQGTTTPLNRCCQQAGTRIPLLSPRYAFSIPFRFQSHRQKRRTDMKTQNSKIRIELGTLDSAQPRIRMSLEPQLPPSLHLQLLPPSSSTSLAPAKSKAEIIRQESASDLLCPNIWKVTSSPQEKVAAKKREKGNPKLAWL